VPNFSLCTIIAASDLMALDARPLHQLSEGRGPLLPGAHLHHHGGEFGGQLGIDELHLLADAHHGLVEGQTGPQHDAQQIDGVGKGLLELAAVPFDQALQNHPRQHDSTTRAAPMPRVAS